MKLGIQLTVCWMMAVSVGGVYASFMGVAGDSDVTYEVASLR